MAKKLNKKIAVVIVGLIVMFVGAGTSYLVYRHIQRNPERALTKGRQALAAGDYKNAEVQLGRAYYFGKTDEYQIERLFELSEFHLIHNEQHEADWGKALSCWKQVITNDPKNLAAYRKLLDFYFQAADSGDERLWKDVHENTTKILEILKAGNTEPDTALLKTHARALLSMAGRGETTNQRQLLQESQETLERLTEQDPLDEEVYLLLAEAAAFEGKLGQLSGVINAVRDSEQKALEWLSKGIQQADDKVTAAANLFAYKRQALINDPNQIKSLQAEIEDYSRTIQPNDLFWVVLCSLYEVPSDTSMEADLNRAIEAIRQACLLKPENVEYTLRRARLLYRNGMSFGDTDAINDSIQMVQAALSWPDAQPVPGPLSGRNRSYRFALNTFLADAYLQQALSSQTTADAAIRSSLEKAEERIAEINSFLGSTDNPIAEKYAGLLALANGEREKGIRLLYKTYESSKAMDKPNELSNVDPLICMVLAQLMKEDNQLGLQREFLEKAMQNKTPMVLQNPQLVLDYAEVIAKFGSWPSVRELVTTYQDRYKPTERSARLLVEASIGEAANAPNGTGDFEAARKLLQSSELPQTTRLELELQLIAGQAAAIQKLATGQSSEKTAPTAEQTAQLDALRIQRDEFLTQLLQLNPDAVNSRILTAACSDLMRNGQPAKAAALLDLYLPSHQDMLNLKVLRAQTEMPNPLILSHEQQVQLHERVYNSLEDPVTRALALSQFYRGENRPQDATKALDALSGDHAEAVDVLRQRFDIALEQEDTASAEKLLYSLRQKNADGCEGALNSAQLEMVKKNYPLALRRLDECLTLKPLDSTVYFLKSQIYQKQEDFESASQNALRAVQMSPLNPLYARNWASILFTRNSALGNKVTVEQRNETERALTMAMYLNPSEWQLQSVYAESIQMQSPDQALLIRQRLLENYPNAQNAVMLGHMAQRMAQSELDSVKKTGLIELAGKAYEKAVELEPDYEAGLQALADYKHMTGKTEDIINLFKGDENLLWKYYLRNGQFEDAEQLLTKLLQQNPADTTLLRGMIMAAEGLGNRDRLKEHLDKLAAAEDSKETELLILQKYLDAGFAMEAEQKLSSFKDRYPDEKAALLIDAWIQMTHGRLEEAMTLTNRYLESDTNHNGAWRLRGRLYRLMNQPQKAIDDLQRSKGLEDSPAVRLELATVYLESRQTSAATGELVSGLQNPQAPAQMRLMLEKIYLQNNQNSNVEKLYSQTLEKYPQSIFWHSRAGRYYLSRNDFANAQALFQKAWDISRQNDPGDMTSLYNTLHCLCLSGKFDEAFTLASGLVDSPFASIAYTFMGQIQAQKEQKPQAIDSFHKALDKIGEDEGLQDTVLNRMLSSVGEEPVNQWISRTLTANPSSISAHLLTSLLAQKNGSYNKAIEPIDQCMAIKGSDNPEWIRFAIKKSNLLIQAYSKTLDQTYLNQSISLFKTILESQPDNPSVLNNLAYLMTNNGQDIKQALEYARKAHQQDPGNAVYLDTYAFAQCKAGDYQTAEQNLMRAIQLYESMQADIPWDLYKHLGIAREGLGKTQQALEAYQQALNTSADTMGSKKQDIPEVERQTLQQVIAKLQQS